MKVIIDFLDKNLNKAAPGKKVLLEIKFYVS